MISIVIPVMNEELVLPELFKRLHGLPVLFKEDVEVVFIDDGSHDRTAELIAEESRARLPDLKIRLLSFSRNFGHQIAISAGLEATKGRVVSIIDGDLQDPPEVIATFLEQWKNGAKIVYGIRQKRKEGIFKRVCYATFYRMLRALSNIPIPLDTGDFCLMDRVVVDAICAMPERNRFLRGLRAWSGYKSVGVPYEREARFAGEPKFTFKKLMKLAMDGLLNFSTVPLQLSTYTGFFFAVISLIAGLGLIVYRLSTPSSSIPQGWASLMVVVFFFGGIQLIVVGILGEYLGRIYTQVQGRPLYIVGRREGFDS